MDISPTEAIWLLKSMMVLSLQLLLVLAKLSHTPLELSNVDLTGEFTSIIANQRGFQAGARIVTVSDAMYGEAVNLKR